MRIAVVLLASLAVLSVSGCNTLKRVGNAAWPGQPFEIKAKIVCNQSNKDYAGAKEMPPLKAPAGLEVPNTRNALKVPALTTPERVRGASEACLDSPPPFAAAKADVPQTK